jgi:hypothetical protein
MTELLKSSQPIASRERFILDDHSLYSKSSNIPVPTDAIYHYLDNNELGATTPTPRIEHVDAAYRDRRAKRAGAMLARLTLYEPVAYSATYNRIVLNSLAHPIQRYLAMKEYGGTIPKPLTKEIEAIYGQGADQLGFLMEQFSNYDGTDSGLQSDIEGGLSELTVFLLTARELTDDSVNPYLIIPSTEAEDRAHITPDGMHHGFDFSVIRQRDNVRIPVQVKTGSTYTAKYPEDILVVSVAELVRDNNASPHNLAEAMHFEISGAQNYDTQLIDAASKRLFNAFDNYQQPHF